MPNPFPAGQWAVVFNGGVATMTLSFDAQGDLVNSTLGNDRIYGTYNSSTGGLSFVAYQTPMLFPSGPPSYDGYLVPKNHNLCGVYQYSLWAAGGWPPTIHIETIQGGWLAYPQAEPPEFTAGPGGVVDLPPEGYFLFINEQTRLLTIGGVDGAGNLVNCMLDENTPVGGTYSRAGLKLTFTEFVQAPDTYTFNSYLGYLLSVKDYGRATIRLAGIMDQTVISTAGGVVTETRSETAWWAQPAGG